MKASEVLERLQKLGSPERARICQGFFKTGPGEYGEGDVFIGIAVPDMRKLAKDVQPVALPDVLSLLHAPFHEARFLALLLLIQGYRAGDTALREKIYTLYLKNTSHINNWDLVDASAEHIVGTHLKDRDRSPLDVLSASKLLWERRIAILATFHFIKGGECGETLRIAERLLQDPEDLMHKAVGWMLREVGKRDLASEERFLKKHGRAMPRTMLRYAIERFPENLRQRYLKGDV